ncbi:MAG: hydroxymethylbilane synthase [Candidatus Omnitrophica bacterium]|nr:hydroxymethylbilane synthase [Candidatus Omnitrophota bacterium]
MKSLIKIGTRGSKLALYQAELVRAKLRGLFPLVEFELVKIHTKGDMIRHASIGSIGPGIFTHEIETALLENRIDLAVHSAKDLATDLPEGLELGAIPYREDPRDCLVAREGKTLEQLPYQARIGTSSLRRRAQLKRLRPDLEICEMRGNVDSRLKKIEAGECAAIVLAHAGLMRLGLSNFVTQIFEEEDFLPQAGQGALAVEIRTGDLETKELVRPLNHEPTFKRVLAERSFLRRLEGGCQVPAGIRSKIENGTLNLKGAVFSLEGDQAVVHSISGPISASEPLGTALADQLLKDGGRKILKAIRDYVAKK